MALPTSYLTSGKNLESILNAIKTAQAPEKFTQKFLESLEFKSNSDRLIIGVLKSLGFIADDGKPTQRYFDFLDQTQSGRVLAEGIRQAYADLFAVNTKAHQLSKEEVMNKFRTLSQGQLSDSVLDKLALTFAALVKHADFEALKPTAPVTEIEKEKEKTKDDPIKSKDEHQRAKIGGLVYNIQLVLPESRDPVVYDVLFKSLRDHLL